MHEEVHAVVGHVSNQHAAEDGSGWCLHPGNRAKHGVQLAGHEVCCSFKAADFTAIMGGSARGAAIRPADLANNSAPVSSSSRVHLGKAGAQCAVNDAGRQAGWQRREHQAVDV